MSAPQLVPPVTGGGSWTATGAGTEGACVVATAGGGGTTVVVTTGGGASVVVTTGGASVGMTGTGVVTGTAVRAVTDTAVVVLAATVDVATTRVVTGVFDSVGGLTRLPIPPAIMITANTPPAIHGHLRLRLGAGAWTDWCGSGIGPHCGPTGGCGSVTALPLSSLGERLPCGRGRRGDQQGTPVKTS